MAPYRCLTAIARFLFAISGGHAVPFFRGPSGRSPGYPNRTYMPHMGWPAVTKPEVYQAIGLWIVPWESVRVGGN